MNNKIFLIGLLATFISFSSFCMEAMETDVKRLHITSAEERLFTAVDKEDSAAVAASLKNPQLDVNAHDGQHSNDTALMKAFRKANIPIVTLLLNDPRTDVTRKNKNGWSVLTYAARPDAPIELLEILLLYQREGRLNPQLDLNLEHFDEACALYFAITWRSWPAALLLSEEPSVDASICHRTSGDQPLHALYEAGQMLPDQLTLLQLIYNLVERGAPISQPNNHNNTPIDNVDRNIGPRLWWPLSAFGEELKEEYSGFVNGVLDTPRGWYDFNRDTIMLRQIPDAITGMTPFMIVAAIGTVDEVKTFVNGDGLTEPGDGWYPTYEPGPNPIQVYDYLQKGITPDEQSALWPREHELTKAYPNARGMNDWHALHFAAYNEHIGVLEYLLSLPIIEIKPLTTSGLTPFAVAKLSLKARGIELQDTQDKAKVPGIIALFQRFEKARLTIFMCLLQHPQARALPIELKESIVNSYRFNCENAPEEEKA